MLSIKDVFFTIQPYPAGPFAIQDLDSSVRGKLDVEIIEQNGKTNKFQIDTAYVPYLTRPGQVRYKVVAGRSRDKLHNTEGPIFGTTEAAFGLSNALDYVWWYHFRR